MIKITLPYNRYRGRVKRELERYASALMVNDVKNLKGGAEKEIIFHTGGFIDDKFDETINSVPFLKNLDKKARLLSFDLGPSCRKTSLSNNGYIAQSRILDGEEIMRIAEKRIADLRKHFKGVLSVENLDYHPSGAYEFVCDPGFISEFIKHNSVRLTLDIGHLEVTCAAYGMRGYDYLKRLPLSKVCEIHFVRSVGCRDAHMLPDRDEYRLLEFVLESSEAEYIVIEYNGSDAGIIRGYKRLIRFLARKGLLRIQA